MFRFITTLFFIMLGFIAGRLTAFEGEVIAPEKTVVASTLEQAAILVSTPHENPAQKHRAMLLAAALLRKIAQKQVQELPVTPEALVIVKEQEVIVEQPSQMQA